MKEENDNIFGIGQMEFYPWEVVEAVRNDLELQADHPLKKDNPPGGKRCPKCGREPEELSWFWFESPKEDWDALAGRAGEMSVCDVCHIQVQFITRILS